MTTLNFKHLRYFWMVAKTGSIARASEQLCLAPQSISGQLSEFESKLGAELFPVFIIPAEGRAGETAVFGEAAQVSGSTQPPTGAPAAAARASRAVKVVTQPFSAALKPWPCEKSHRLRAVRTRCPAVFTSQDSGV